MTDILSNRTFQVTAAVAVLVAGVMFFTSGNEEVSTTAQTETTVTETSNAGSDVNVAPASAVGTNEPAVEEATSTDATETTEAVEATDASDNNATD